jgi:hypothetical protein
LFIWLSFSIYRQIINQPDLEEHLLYIKEAMTGERAGSFWVVIVLMLVNWGIEARKWQLLMRVLELITFWRSFKAILSGVALAMNTPNRIGEYGGRILYVSEGKRLSAVSLTIAGSFSQLIVTLVAGNAGLFFLSDEIIRFYETESLTIWMKLLWGVMLAITSLCILIYFRMSWLIHGIEKLPGLSRFRRYIAVIKEMNVTILLRVLSLSIVRFMVFVIQYRLLLHVMHVEVGWWQGFWAISVLFLLLAIWPTIALLELGLRWEYSLILFKLFSQNTVGIYAAATGIWLINLVIPAIAGSLFLLGVRIFKEKLKQQ